MSIFRQIFRPDPNFDFSKGKTAFEEKKYKSAYRSFMKAYKRFNSLDMQLLALDNAAVSAEKASIFEEASECYYKAVLLKLSDNRPTKEVMIEIDHVLQAIRLSKNPSIPSNKLLYMKLLIFLSKKQFDKLSSFYKKLRMKDNDEYKEAINTTWNLVHSKDTLEMHTSLPNIELPNEFNTYKKEAEHIMQRFGLCSIVLNEYNDPNLIQKGSEFSILVSLTAHSALSIKSINLKTGTRGRVLTSSIPELPLNLSSGENYSIIFSLLPNLPGEWVIGPLAISYSIPSEGEFEFPASSQPINVTVKEALPSLTIIMEKQTIEEDFEYLLRIKTENTGKTALMNVKLLVELPEGVQIIEGTTEKFISTFVEGETFQYEILVRFVIDQTHFDGHIIKAIGFIDENQQIAKSSIKLGGNKKEEHD